MPPLPLRVRLNILWIAFRIALVNRLRGIGLLPKARPAGETAPATTGWPVLSTVAALVVALVGGLIWSLIAPNPLASSIERPSPLGEGAEIVARGQFVGQGGRDASGEAILGNSVEGTPVLRLQGLEVTGSADLRVWLSRHATPSTDVEVRDGWEIGALRATRGSFHYVLPDAVDLDAVESVVLYAAPSRTIVGVATLE